MNTIRQREPGGFTLVELLIVVVILGLLAAVVLPQINGVTAASKESALDADLGAIRQAISLYRVQHKEQYPGPLEANVVEQLTQRRPRWSKRT